MAMFGQTQQQKLAQTLSPQAQQSLRILALPATDLRAELQREMSQNPVIDDVTDSSTIPLDDAVASAAAPSPGDADASYDVPDVDNYSGADDEARERRDRFFESRIAPISLHDHLIMQLALEGFSPEDERLAARIIDDIDERGVFTGSIPDYEMATGASRAKIEELIARIRSFDSDPQRGAFYDSSRAGYVKPEVHLVRGRDGAPDVAVDGRAVPDIRISPKYIKMISDPRTDPETRAYLAERIRAAEALRDALANRDETIRRVARAIVDVQGDYLTKKAGSPRPLTMRDIAEKVGVHETTVSRTVNGKWISTPRGAVRLHDLFVSQYNSVPDLIKKAIDAEDGRHPLSDRAISEKLKKDGVDVARRTVAKYREQLNIPGAAERRTKA